MRQAYVDHQVPAENPWVAKLLGEHRDEFAALDNRIKHERGAAVSECKLSWLLNSVATTKSKLLKSRLPSVTPRTWSSVK